MCLTNNIFYFILILYLNRTGCPLLKRTIGNCLEFQFFYNVYSGKLHHVRKGCKYLHVVNWLHNQIDVFWWLWTLQVPTLTVSSAQLIYSPFVRPSFSGKTLVPTTLPCPQRAHRSEIIKVDSAEVDHKRSTSICKRNQISLNKNANICSYYLPYLGQNASPESVMRNLLKTKFEIKLAINNLVHFGGELSYLAPPVSEKISAPYFKQYFFRGEGVLPP